MLEIWEQLISLPDHRAPRAGLSSLAIILASSNFRTRKQRFATPLELCRSICSGRTSSRTHHFAAAQNNSFRMILLYKSQNNFRRGRRPGRIVSRETLLESANSGENRLRESLKNKSLRITSLCKCKNNCPGITLLQKKGGEGAVGALLRPLLEFGGLISRRTGRTQRLAYPRAARVGRGKHSLPRWEDMIMCSPI